MTARNDIFDVSKNNSRSVYFSILISAVLHLVFLAILIYSPSLKPNRKIMPPSLNVSLVSLPDEKPGPPLKKKATKVRRTDKKTHAKPVVVPDTKPKLPAEKKEEPVPEPVVEKAEIPEPEPKPVVEKVEKPAVVEEKPKVSLKKQTIKTGKLVEPSKAAEKEAAAADPDSVAKAIEKLKQSVDQDRKDTPSGDQSDSVAKAIAKIRENIEDTGPDGGDDVDAPGLSGATGGGSANGELTEMDLYGLEIKDQIQRNWVFSEQAAGARNLQTVLVIKIMSNGEIKDVWFEQKSGNTYLDDSAQKAILKSNPLPPLPQGYKRAFYTVGMIFTPSGVQ